MSEPQLYTIKEWKAWPGATDDYGNQTGTVAFEEYSSEPVDARFKPPVEVGQKKYGVVETYETKKGATRTRFVRKDKPQDAPSAGGRTWQPRDDSAIQAQWAIGQAVAVTNLTEKSGDYEIIEQYAKEFFAMIDRVKRSGGGD